MSGARPRVMILGGGFAGLFAAQRLARAPVDVVVYDRTNHHLFQPLLYQVATAALAAPDVASPIRRVLRRQKNATVLLDEATRIDPGAREVHFKKSGRQPYDHLIVATGARHTYFGHDEWEQHAPGLKTLEDAFNVRYRIISAFEEAERLGGGPEAAPWLRFVVVGAGPTGVELAGAIAEIARKTLTRDFRRFSPGSAEVILVEGGPRVLPAMVERLSDDAVSQLQRLGVEVLLDTKVTAVDARGVDIDGERIDARTVLWAAGNQASPLGRDLGSTDRAGRVNVRPTLEANDHDNVYVCGDLAHFEQDGAPVPGVAPAALQMGRHAADNIRRQVAGEKKRPFRYLDKGTLATIGRKKAVGRVAGLNLTGTLAWLGWLFVHLIYLVGFRNRAVVVFEWAYSYVTYQRSARVVVDAGGGVVDPRAPVPKSTEGTAARETT